MDLSPQEKAAVEIIRLNKLSPRLEIVRSARIGRWSFKYVRRLKGNIWGRFGGGWNWKLGFQAGGSTLILNLLVAYIIIKRHVD